MNHTAIQENNEFPKHNRFLSCDINVSNVEIPELIFFFTMDKELCFLLQLWISEVKATICF